MDVLTPNGVTRADGWENLLTGHGTTDRDKTRAQVQFRREALGYGVQSELWKTDWLAARIVERPVEDGMREGYDVSTGDRGLDDAMRGWLEDIDADQVLAQCWRYQRAYGGGAILIGVDDGQTVDQPLREDMIRRFDWALVVDPAELWVQFWDKAVPGFVKPEMWRANLRDGTSIHVHPSRVLTMRGPIVSNGDRYSERGYGVSVLDRVHYVVSQYHLSWAGVHNLMAELGEPVLSIEGLAELMAQNKEADVKARLQLLDLCRSTLGTALRDNSEGYERVSPNLGGVGETMRQMVTQLAAAADMPATLLMGQSPDGLNATGASDIRGYYDRVAGMWRLLVKPVLERLCKIGLSILTRGQFTGDYKIEPNPLWQATDEEVSTQRLRQAQQDQIYLAEGVLTPDEVAASRFRPSGYSFETTVNMEQRRRLAAARSAPPPAPSAGLPSAAAPAPPSPPPLPRPGDGT